MIDLLNLGRITSYFGKRKSPTAGASSNHKGIDIVLKSDNVPAVTGGTVIYNGIWGGGGNTLKIQDENGNVHHYLHLANKPSFSVGDKVSEGQTIGIQGSTGNVTGKHLHYEVHNSSGTAVNPIDFLKGATGKPSGSNVVSQTDSDDGFLNWKTTAKNIGKSVTVVVFVIVLIIIMFLTFTNAMGMKLF